MSDDTYQLVRNSDGYTGIICELCGMTSYHPGDIQHRYCGACKQYHGALYALPEQQFVPAGPWVRAHAERPLAGLDAEFLLAGTGVRFYGRYFAGEPFPDGAFDAGPFGQMSWHIVSFWRPVSAK